MTAKPQKQKKAFLSNALILLPLLLTGAVLLSPLIRFQPYLSQGDHCRGIYAYIATLNGQAPYQDYWWIYGPLMPYYYAFFLKILGPSLSSILAGEALLKLLAGIFFFLSLKNYTRSGWAYLATVCFWVFFPFFTFTYNHTGAVALILAAFWCLTWYQRTQRPPTLYAGLTALLAVSLIKINFGICSLFCYVLSVWIISRRHGRKPGAKIGRFYITALLLTPLATVLIYYPFVHKLSEHMVRQCFPYLNTDHQSSSNILQNPGLFWNLLKHNLTASFPHTLLAVLILISLRRGLALISANNNRQEKKSLMTGLIMLLVFFVFLLHEFLLSGTVYRVYWALPFGAMIIAVCGDVTIRPLSRIIKFSFYLLIILLAVAEFGRCYKLSLGDKPAHRLPFKGLDVLTYNDKAWVNTVRETNRLLALHLNKDETFLALPYDPIFYVLNGQPSPTWLMIFFQYNNIPPQQENQIIADLEAGRVGVIVMSNRVRSQEAGLGTFGDTHCRQLNNYILSHYQEKARVGDWQHEPMWAWNYGTKILVRSKPFPER